MGEALASHQLGRKPLSLPLTFSMVALITGTHLSSFSRSSPSIASTDVIQRSCPSACDQDGPHLGPKARRHHRAGRLPTASLRSGRVPWLGAHVPTGRRGEDMRTRRQRSTPCRWQLLAGRAGHSPSPAGPCRSVGLGFPHRAACNHGRDRPARNASGAPTASLRELRPLTRTAPNLRSAAIGAMREVRPCA